MGRDVLSRLIYGSRVSLLVAFSAVIIAGCIGTFLGLMAGFFGGWVDQVIMRFTDAWLSIPTVMFGVLMAVICRPRGLEYRHHPGGHILVEICPSGTGGDPEHEDQGFRPSGQNCRMWKTPHHLEAYPAQCIQ